MSFGSVADVTVVIATFNRARFISETISSILNQDILPSRVIVVDDGSVDDTQGIVDNFQGRVEYFKKENGGKAKALNFIIPFLETRYVWFFDDDDAAYPYALRVLLNEIKDCDQVGFVFGSYDVVKTDGHLIDSKGRFVPYLYEHESRQQQRLRLFRECTVMMSGSLIRTDMVRTIGGFNENLVRCQDYDLMVRLAAVADFKYCGSSVYMWREHDGLRGTLNDFHADQNRVKVWAKYNEPIGRYIRYQLSINMLGCRDSFPLKENELIRDALINRAWIVAPKLPLIFSILDILEAFHLGVMSDMDSAELEKLQQIFHHDFVGYRNSVDLLRLFSLCKTYQGCIALANICKGIYWTGRGCSGFLKRFQFIFVAGTLSCVARLGKVFLCSSHTVK